MLPALTHDEVQARLLDTWQLLLGVAEAGALPRPKANVTTLPLTLIAGYLGAGKTTLLNHLLTAPHGRRLTVLVNDFGSVAVDAALIADRSDDMITLTNGCACCSMAGGLTRVLATLTEREARPDHIVCEASGIADPRGLAQAALVDPQIVVRGTVTVVDAAAFAAHSADGPIAGLIWRQIEAADLVVLNKCDLVPLDALPSIRNRIDGIKRTGADVIATTHGAVVAEQILALRPTKPPTDLDNVPFAPPAFETETFECAAPLERIRLEDALQALPTDVARVKGFVYLADDLDWQHLLQGAGGRWSTTRHRPWGATPRRTELVLIGLPGFAASLPNLFAQLTSARHASAMWPALMP